MFRLKSLLLGLMCWMMLARGLPAQEIGVVLSAVPQTSGITLRAQDGESHNQPITIGGRTGWQSVSAVPADPTVHYMYFQVEDARFEVGRIPSVMVCIEYFDQGTGVVNIVYDSSDATVLTVPATPGAWKTASQITLGNSGTWKRSLCAISDAQFAGRCNGADLRLEISGGATPPIAELSIRRLTRICMSDAPTKYAASAEGYRTRYARYAEIGVDALRIANFDDWMEHPEMLAPLQESALRIKYILYMLPIPPAYGALYPDERMKDNRGLTDWHMGPWNREFAATVTQTGRASLQEIVGAGLADRVDEVCIDLGPAGEGIYPANWTLNQTGDEGFWCYSAAAQADFRTQMQAQYTTIAAANAAWNLSGGTAFANWSAVTIPPPGTEWAKGPFWNDMLTWYRDSKRRMIVEQIDITQALVREYLGNDVRFIVYLPGTTYFPAEWDEAVATAMGSWSIRLMCDTDWLMLTALEKGCLLQYTGVENGTEVARIVAKLKETGHDAYELMWGENAGYEATARNPYALARVITHNNLRGVDLTFSNWVFDDDGVTTNETYVEFAHTIDTIQTYYATGAMLPPLPPRGLVEQTQPGQWSVGCMADTRVMGAYPEAVKGDEDSIAVVEGGQSQRILLNFPLDQLPADLTIGKATLVMTRSLDWGDLTAATLGVFRVTEPWLEGDASWNYASFGVPWSQAGGAALGSNGLPIGHAGAQPYAVATMGPAEGGVPAGDVYPKTLPGDLARWDVTELVKALRTGSNHGMMVTVTSGAGNKTFASRQHVTKAMRPVLLIEAASLAVKASMFSSANQQP